MQFINVYQSAFGKEVYEAELFSLEELLEEFIAIELLYLFTLGKSLVKFVFASQAQKCGFIFLDASKH